MGIEIQILNPEHADAVYELEQLCMPHPWTKDDIDALMNAKNKFAMGAFARDESGLEVLAGYVGISFILDEAEIGNVCTHPAFRRQHVATRILAAVNGECRTRDIRRIFLEVARSNRVAALLYENCGYKYYSYRKGYYPGGEDALLYVWEAEENG